MSVGRLVDAPSQGIKRGNMKDLFIPELKVTTLLLWVIWLVCAFSYYGIVLLTTALFESPDGCHGTDVKLNANPACFLECKSLTTKDYKDLTWTTFAEFPGLFITAFLLEKVGRKATMMVEFLVFTVFVLLVNICTTRVLLTFFLFFQVAFVYTPEVYPTSMRALGLGACSGMARIGAITTPFVAQVLLKVSAYIAISTYGCMCLIATLAAFFLPIETKGET